MPDGAKQAGQAKPGAEHDPTGVETREHRKRRELGCWCFWSFEVRLIHCDSRDLEYTIGSTLAYHECCRQSRIGYSTAQGVRSASSQKQKEALEKIQDWTDRTMNFRARFEASYPRVYSLHPRLFLGAI